MVNGKCSFLAKENRALPAGWFQGALRVRGNTLVASQLSDAGNQEVTCTLTGEWRRCTSSAVETRSQAACIGMNRTLRVPSAAV